MKLFKIEVKNFRLLKDFVLYPEDDLSLIIGKNNVGKTSLLAVLASFLQTRPRFNFDDFNLQVRQGICESLTNPSFSFTETAISLRLYISYDEHDSLDRVEGLLTNLAPENNVIILGFDFVLTEAAMTELRKEYAHYIAKIDDSADAAAVKKDPLRFVDRYGKKYFVVRKRSIEYDVATGRANEARFIDLEKDKVNLDNVICFKMISAKRDVKNGDVDTTLSDQVAKLYDRSETVDDQQLTIEKFHDQLIVTDGALTEIYEKIFERVIANISRFGGVKAGETSISVKSTLQTKELLAGNTTVVYDQAGQSLPEHFNGLGYMNLLSIIFEMELLLGEIRAEIDDCKPAEINLLFIEEPEAHTHPQLQYIFIKNIKDLTKSLLTREDGSPVRLQTFLTTHSAHIVAASEFDDIKYFARTAADTVVARNLRDLKFQYDAENENAGYKFLKQYLTLNRAELFFADKCVLVEGETERILMPAFFKKLDLEGAPRPLLSQNISVVEVGAHSKIFEKFLSFINLKTLIITDIDAAYDRPKKNSAGVLEVDDKGKQIFEVEQCPASDPEASYSSNSSLKFFYGSSDVKHLIAADFKSNKVFRWTGTNWIADPGGNLAVVYQTVVDGYCGRSFEDAFIKLNENFFKSTDVFLPSVTKKWLELYRSGGIDAFTLASKVNSKPSLAIEILLNSNETFSQWTVPAYIAEGLQWLAE